MTAYFLFSLHSRLMRVLGGFCLVACLALALLFLGGCAQSQEGGAAQGQAAQAAQQASSYTVELKGIDGEALLADLKSDPPLSDEAALVSDIRLSIDGEARRVDMTVSAATSDVARMCAVGQAAARCLSSQAKVEDGEGNPPADEGPCGALYQAYVLSVRVQGIASDDVVDGLLHPGDSDMTWQ